MGQKSFYDRAEHYKWVFQHISWGNIDANYAETLSKDSVGIKGTYYRKFQNYFIRQEGFKVYLLLDSTLYGYSSNPEKNSCFLKFFSKIHKVKGMKNEFSFRVIF